MFRAGNVRFKWGRPIWQPRAGRGKARLLYVEVLERRQMLSATDLSGAAPPPDTQPPQIVSIRVGDDPTFNLFATNPTLAARPPVNSLEITFVDPPIRPQESILEGHHVVFVLDASDSMKTPLNGIAGDMTRFQAEIKAVKDFNDRLIARGLSSFVDVSIVAFNSAATQVDMDPSVAGVQLAASPSADTDGNSQLDVDQALDSIPTDSGTDFEKALAKTIDTVQHENIQPHDGDVIFLSDGFPTNTSSILGDVSTLSNMGIDLFAYGIGAQSKLSSLQKIYPNASRLFNPDDLLNVFTSGGVADPAVNSLLASNTANYQLVGDDTGPVTIQAAFPIQQTTLGGDGITTVELLFAKPLANDSYHLTISDALTDNAGNPLDGESHGSLLMGATFPSGDGIAGGSFVAGLTIANLPPTAPATITFTPTVRSAIDSSSNTASSQRVVAFPQAQPTTASISFSRATTTISTSHDAGGGQPLAQVNVVALLPLSNDSNYGGGEPVLDGQVPDVVMVQFQAVTPEIQVAELSDVKPETPDLPELKPISEEPLTLPKPPVAMVEPATSNKWYVVGASGAAFVGSLFVLLGPTYWRRRKQRSRNGIRRGRPSESVAPKPRTIDSRGPS